MAGVSRGYCLRNNSSSLAKLAASRRVSMAATYAEQDWLATISSCPVRKSQQNNRAEGPPRQGTSRGDGHQPRPSGHADHCGAEERYHCHWQQAPNAKALTKERTNEKGYKGGNRHGHARHEFSLCQDDNVATLAVLDIPSNRGGCLYLKSTSGSLAKLAAIFHPSSLVSRLAAVRRPGSCYSRNSQAAVRLIADDEAGIVHLVDGPRRREAARLTHFRRSTLTALAGRSGSSGTITASQAAKWLGREGPPRYARPTGCPSQPRPPCDD